MVVTGSKAYVQYGWESSFGSETATYDKVFGIESKVSVKQGNNLIKLYGLNDVEAKKVLPGKYSGSLSIDFTPTDFYFLKGVFGSVTDAGTGPYTHTYPASSSDLKTVTSASVEIGVDLSTDSVLACVGGVFSNFTLSGTQGDKVSATLDIPFKTVSHDSTLDTSPASSSEEPFTFANASIEVPDGTSISNVQDFKVTVNRNAEMVYAIGSRTAQAVVPKQTSYEVVLTVPYEDVSTFMSKFWGASTGPSNSVSEIASAQLNITNGLSGTDERSLAFTIAGLQVSDDSLDLPENDLVSEGVTLVGRSITSAVYTNNTATAL